MQARRAWLKGDDDISLIPFPQTSRSAGDQRSSGPVIVKRWMEVPWAVVLAA
jgi:hypothetical protein